jgi:hypothetical protein
MKYTFSTFILLLSILFSKDNAHAQSIFWKEKEISNMPAIQSYAWGKVANEIIFIGGRHDGLHPKQPWASFHPDFRNDSIYVVNPSEGKVFAAGMQFLPIELKEQLSSSNMQFTQDGDTLIIVGGYGYSVAIDDKKTF